MESHEAGFPPPSHNLWKSLRDSHIPTALDDWILVFSCALNLMIATARGL